MAPDPGPLWNHRGGQQRLGYSSLEFLTDLAAASGPKRVFSSMEWVMKLISKKKASFVWHGAYAVWQLSRTVYLLALNVRGYLLALNVFG